METAVIVLILTNLFSFNAGKDNGIEQQKYYDRMMREKIGQVIYDKAYKAGLTRHKLDDEIRKINRLIDYVGKGSKDNV